jgi:hypothetical protein
VDQGFREVVANVFKLLVQRPDVLLDHSWAGAISRMPLTEGSILKFCAVCECDDGKRFAVEVERCQGEMRRRWDVCYKIVKHGTVGEGQR